eukprot:TRINITY_DN71_c1_g1_i2.p2 TRINITY_DN71_c1_g1~~TRINITY_DN71_c1_g1_i2.p2  ORF type:complete len:550 (-),score=231.04 TRINITY_DN71_c1_g1_i2:41-1690(-)
MREFTVEGSKVLLARTSDGAWRATSSKCTHYGAPLVKGTLQGDRVLCPWHGACFDLATGDVEDAPAIDGLHTFTVTVEGGRVLVSGVAATLAAAAATGDGSTATKRVPGMCGKRGKAQQPPGGASSGDTFVILGGGAAGAVAAETLRQEGFGGRVVLVCQEEHLPYDRVKLSKNLSVAAASIALRPAEFYARHGIEIMLGTTATAVDAGARTVTTDRGGVIPYTKLLIATGGHARQLTMSPGYDLGGIHTLRVPSDAHAINALADANPATVVVVGSSFIGMEAAACLKQAKKIARVVVVGMETVPFERVLGAEIGAAMQRLHEDRGIEFRMQSTVKEFRAGTGADSGSVRQVVLSGGEVIDCDFCVVGAGIICATDYLKASGFETERDGSLIVDDKLRIAKGKAGESGDVFAAGDVARFPYAGADGSLIRIEHWDVAQQQGRVAARNMLGGNAAYETVPFFWTAQFGKSLRYAGNCMAPTDIIIKGSLDDLEFVAYYVCGGRVTAVATMGADPVAVAASELLRQGKMPSVASVKRSSELLYLAGLVKPI